jgi:DNA gyrase inhibitor GyrI
MKDHEVRIITLDPMWVACVKVTSASPERDAVSKLRVWAESKGLLADPVRHPIFGFDDPPFGSRVGPRGYEAWIRIDGKSAADGAVELKRFDGGRYAVTRCEVRGEPTDVIPKAWDELAEWARSHGHRLGAHRSLEMHIDPAGAEGGFVVDLYCPIAG